MLAFLVADPSDVHLVAGLFVGTTLAVAYLSYSVGTDQFLFGIDALVLTPVRAPRLTTSVERLVVAIVFGVTLLVRAHTRRREYAAERAPPLAERERPTLDRRIADLFATHPDTNHRVARLLERADPSHERTGAIPGRARAYPERAARIEIP